MSSKAPSHPGRFYPAALKVSLAVCIAHAAPNAGAQTPGGCGSWVRLQDPVPLDPIIAMCPWDPDGPGPATPLVAAVCSANQGILSGTLWSYDPLTGRWSTLAAFTGRVTQIASTSSGELFVGGQPTTVGGVPATFVAKFAAGAWTSPSVGGPTTTVVQLAQATDGALLVRTQTQFLRYDGATWAPAFAGPVPPGDSVVFGPDASTYLSRSTPVNGSELARWDGSGWVDLPPTGLTGLSAISALPGGRLVVAGSPPASTTTCTRVVLWDGTSWVALDPTGCFSGTASIRVLMPLQDGSILAAGEFVRTPDGIRHIARWDGTAWRRVGQTINTATAPRFRSALELSGGDLLLGGDFIYPFGTWSSVRVNADIAHFMRFNGTEWSAGTSGLNGPAYATTIGPTGELYAAGVFSQAGTGPGSRVAVRRANRWAGLGSADWGTNPSITALHATARGDLIAGGFFSSAGGVPAANIARWNGSQWSPLGTGTNGSVSGVFSTPSGDLIAYGGFTSAGGVPAAGIARWSGGVWSPVSGRITRVTSAAALPDGRLLIAGRRTESPSSNLLMVWDGTSLLTLATFSGFNTAVYSMLPVSSGDFFVAGAGLGFSVALEAFARVSGGQVLPVGDGLRSSSSGAPSARAVVQLPGGDLVVGGAFNAPSPVLSPNIARWDGTVWSAMGTGIPFDGPTFVQSLAVGRDGLLYVAGNFFYPDYGVTAYRYASSCRVDFDCSGTRTIDDLLLFLNAWFAGSTATDTDSDGVQTIDDIFLFLNLWFAGC